MSDPIGTPENPAVDISTGDDFIKLHPGITKVSLPDGTYYYKSRTGQFVDPVTYKGQYDSVWNEPIEGIPDIGVPEEEGYDLRLDLGNGQYEEWDLDATHGNVSSLIEASLEAIGYDDAMISWVKLNWKKFTFEDDRTIDVGAALTAYNAFLITNPMYEDRYYAEERGGKEPVEQAYGIDYRMFRDAMVDALQTKYGKGIEVEQLRLEEEKKQTEYLAQIAAARAKEEGFAGENILQYIQRILRAGAPVSGERSIEDFMTRVLPKINLIGQAAVTGASLVQNYQRASNLEMRANQAFLAEDYNAFDRLDLQAYRMGNRVQQNLLALSSNIERYTPELAAKSYLALIKEPTPYVKKGKVPKYRTYKTSAVEVPKVTSKAIADKQSAKIKALEAKIADLTASFKKLKGQA